VAYQPLHETHDVVLGEKGRLDVQLGELRLAVGAQVLVPETAHDLVVAVEARDHQQLFEDLWRLWQGEELARMRTRGHQIVARALRCRLGKHRRLEIDEAVVIQVGAHGTGEPMPQTQP
jgi:hypothetical protein